MTEVRSLTGKLSFEADTTGATRFDKAAERSKSKLNDLNAISLSGFVSTTAKAFGLVGGILTAGSLSAAKKFADLETSYDALGTAAADAGGTIRKEIEGILDDKLLKNLVDEVDLVSAALGSAQDGAQAKDITRFLKLAATLAIISKKDPGELLGKLVKGDVQGILTLIGQMPLALQEIFKAGGIGPDKVGLMGKRDIVNQRLFAILPQLEAVIAKQREAGLTTFTELSGAFEKLAIEIGEKTLPAFDGLNKAIIPVIEAMTTVLGGKRTETGKIIDKKRAEGRELEGVPFFPVVPGQPAEAQETPQFIKNIADAIEKRRLEVTKKAREADVAFFPAVPGQTGNGGNNGTSIKIDKIEVRVESGNTDAQTGQNVAKEIRKMMGDISEQAKQSTPIRGGD